MPVAVNKKRTSPGSDSGAGSPARRRETSASRRGPNQNGCREPVAGSRTQATVPCKWKFSSKCRCDSSSAGTRPGGRTKHSRLKTSFCNRFRLIRCDSSWRCGIKCSGNSSSRQWNWLGGRVAVRVCHDPAPIRPAIQSSHAESLTCEAIRLG